MSPTDQQATRPVEIQADLDDGLMRILWQDGHESIYGLPALRQHCPCAMCKGEMGIPGAVRPETTFSAGQITLEDMREVGRYALQPIWGDGHQTGYYTFVQLRALCPCEVCRATQ